MSGRRRDGDGGKPGKGRHMTVEEAELWALMTTKATPLSRVKRRIVPALEALPTPGSIPVRKAAETPLHAKAPHRSVPAPRPPVAPKRPEPPPIARFERRMVRKVVGGQLDIDARLDLHGLKAEESRHRLRSFVLSCAAEGLRLVLVITGKGRVTETSDDVITATQRGVLRRLVPLWLGEHDLRGAVLSFTAASARHGGEGALYVRLRRRR